MITYWRWYTVRREADGTSGIYGFILLLPVIGTFLPKSHKYMIFLINTIHNLIQELTLFVRNLFFCGFLCFIDNNSVFIHNILFPL